MQYLNGKSNKMVITKCSHFKDPFFTKQPLNMPKGSFQQKHNGPEDFYLFSHTWYFLHLLFKVLITFGNLIFIYSQIIFVNMKGREQIMGNFEIESYRKKPLCRYNYIQYSLKNVFFTCNIFCRFTKCCGK